MKKNNLLKIIFANILIALLGISCVIGLDKAIDLVGPEVTITSPIMRECVSENFTITGTVYDNFEVATLTVSLEGGREWKNEKGVWTYRENANASYVPYAAATWVVGDNKKITWKIENANTINNGKQLLTVTAVDTTGNTSADSKKTVTIIYDKAPPVTTITNPYIKYENLSDIQATFPQDKHTELQIVNNVLTGGFTISGVTKDDNPINYVRVYVNKSDGTNLVTKDLKLKGATITGVSLTNPEEKDTLRSWTVEISDAELSTLGTGKTYLQIATEAADASGNKDAGVKVHGYVLLWKDADKPWITVNVGGSEADKTNVYSGSKIQGTAYDNKKVTEVRCTIKKGGSVVTGYNDIALDLGSTGEDAVQAINFSFDYPSDVGTYQILLTAKDENGNTGSTTGWINVQDMTFPSIEVEEIENPFGDASGKVVIKTHAYDDTGVANIKYKICSTATDKTNYASKNSGSWSSPTATISSFDTTESVMQNGFARKKYNKDIEINLFGTLLNIGMASEKNKLEQTTFIFLVEDLQGNKSITKFVLPADTTPPTVTLDKVAGKASTVSSLPIFLDDFEISGTWGDDSFEAWKSNSTSVTNGKPKLTVKIRGTELTTGITQSDDGTWKATVPLNMVKENGSVVGAMDVEVSITDIGGSTTTVQKGYQIDTDVPTLDYVSCNKINGTYPAGTGIEIYLNMTREFTFDGTNKTGTPELNLNNGKTATYQRQDGKKLVFKYTVANDDDTENLSAKKLLVTSVDLKGYKIKAKSSSNEFKEDDLNTAISSNNINKDICILTSVPTYKSHSWDDTANKLTIVFDGLVTAKSGTITITQDESTLLAPAYLTKDEYNNMSTAVQAYYNEGTIGASSTFVPDLATKYVLDYNTDTNDTTLLTAYKATNAHKRSVNILSENVTSTKNTTAKTTSFEITFGELPCKGANYTFDIPASLVKNDAGTVNTGRTGLSISSTGTEEPVIRIYKPQQVITGASTTSSGTVIHKLSTTFRIDCLTPGVNLKYSYDCLVATDCKVKHYSKDATWGGTAGNINDRQEEWHINYTYNGITTSTINKERKPTITPEENSGYSQSKTGYTKNSKIDIGKYDGKDIDHKNGLTYKITAYINDDAKAYEVAYRTTLVIKNFNDSDGRTNMREKRNFWNWKNDNAAVFLRGGENTEGANSTSGLPCTWNINEKDKIVMMKKDGNDFYFTTWNITVNNFYWQPMAGLCDTKTNTSTNKNDTDTNQGPAQSIFLQDKLMFRIPDFPIGKGEYMIFYLGIKSGNDQMERFDFNVPGKVMNHR